MIKLSNGHQLEHLAASGALAFDGRGWPWDWPFRLLGLIDPRLFTIVIKTITLDRCRGNFKIYAPFRVLKFISEEGGVINPFWALVRPNLIGGVVNNVGLTNLGVEHWLEKDYPTIKRLNYKVIVSITGTLEECVKIVMILYGLENIVGIEYNTSCPSIDPLDVKNIIRTAYAIKKYSDYPLLIKLGYTQPYVEIAQKLEGKIEAISINSVRWRIIFPEKESPLKGYNEGGFSGRIAQPFIWKMVSELSRKTTIPVIGPTIWEYEDIWRLKYLGASACHFGTIFLPYPWRPSMYVKRWIREQSCWIR